MVNVTKRVRVSAGCEERPFLLLRRVKAPSTSRKRDSKSQTLGLLGPAVARAECRNELSGSAVATPL